MAKKVKDTTEVNPDKTLYYYAVGRRKTATAQVRLYAVANGEVLLNNATYKAGDMIVNDRPVTEYFSGELLKKQYLEPFAITNTLNRFFVSVTVSGGGIQSQLEAISHGVSRALIKIDEESMRPPLKKKRFLTRDPRARQRRKAGFAQKARKRKQSPKR